MVAALLSLACSSEESGGGGAGSAGTSGNGGSGGSGASGGSAGNGGSGGSSGTGGSAGSGGSPATPEVRFIGRVETNGQERTFAWSGTAIAFRFEGTDASITLDDDGRFFTLLVDGQEQLLPTSSGEQSYTLASGLTPGEHEIWLHRRTEALFGNTRFIDLDLGGGTLLPPPPPAARRIEIIGDSITCGYGNEGADEFCDFSASTENHYLTYGAIAARNLGAELSTVAWSGKGIIYNYGDDKNEPMPELYARTLPQDASSSWDFSWQPDVVVINLGTNDFSTDGDPSEGEFAGAYEAFLADIRNRNQTAHILCVIPTLLGGNDLANAKAYIEQAVAARNAAGDDKVKAVALSFDQSGWGCDYHPSLETHASMGAALTAELQAWLGW